jgi:hypothetical protein
MAASIKGSRAPNPERRNLTAALRQQLGKSRAILGNSAERNVIGLTFANEHEAAAGGRKAVGRAAT